MDWIKVKDEIARELAGMAGTPYDSLDPINKAACDVEAMDRMRKVRGRYRRNKAIQYAAICACLVFLVAVLA